MGASLGHVWIIKVLFMQTINILGSKLNIISKQELIEKAELVLAQNEKSYHFFSLNPIKVIKAQSDQTLDKYINNADIVYPDAIGLSIASRILYGLKLERVTGYDFHFDVLKICQKMKFSVYFLGSTDYSLKKAVAKYEQDFPGLIINGTHNGYFSDKCFFQTILPEIIQLQPKLIIVAMGAKLQEKWIEEIRSRTIVPMMMGVGGSLDTYVGNYPLGPKWVIKYGLLWLYRLIKQPSRYKVMSALPKFALQVLIKKINI